MAAHPIETLYRAHSRALLAHCTHRLGNAAQARDAVHDTFERVMRAHARELFDEAHAAPYLFRTDGLAPYRAGVSRECKPTRARRAASRGA